MERLSRRRLFFQSVGFLTACSPSVRGEPQRRPIPAIRSSILSGSDEISRFNLHIVNKDNPGTGTITIDLKPNAFTLGSRTEFEQVIPPEGHISIPRAIHLYQLTSEGMFISPVFEFQDNTPNYSLDNLRARAKNYPKDKRAAIEKYDPRNLYFIYAAWDNTSYEIKSIRELNPEQPILPNQRST